MKARNQPVGTCPCPIDPAHTCDVYQFASRAKTDTARRKGGKFYIDCRGGHGRLGFDGSSWVQEHVLDHITWSKDRPTDTSATQQAPAQEAGGVRKPVNGAPGRKAPSGRAAASSAGKHTDSQTQTRPQERHWWDDL